MKNRSTFRHGGRLVRIALMLVGLALLSGCAVDAGDGNPSGEGETGKAMLSGRPGVAARDLFAVEFLAIDGRNISPRDVIWVEPGRRTVTVRVPERFTESQINQRREKWPDFIDIELDLQANHAYEIRGRFNRTNRDNPYDIIIDRIQAFGDD